MDSLKWRGTIAIVGLLLAIAWVLPNVVETDKLKILGGRKLNYGLDIQGGLHLVMGVDVEGVVRESSVRLSNVIREELVKREVLTAQVSTPRAEAGEILVSFPASEEVRAKVVALLEERYATMLQVMASSSTEVTARYYDAYMTEYRSRVIHQAIETIRNRIDEFGVAEPSISQQGADRILVQLPGIADAERAKQLVNTTAKLDFMPVVDDGIAGAQLQQMIQEAEKAGQYSLGTLKYSDYVARLNQDLKDKLPANTILLFEKQENAETLEAGRIPMILRTDSGLGGADLDDAFVSFDQYGAPEVSLRFNASGANKFATLTSQNVGKRVAVVLDKVVKTAPNIRQAITGGNAVITLGGGRDRKAMTDEAKMISMSLRAGALPASLQQLEERRVGPTLGADSIRRAELGALVGAIAIFLFMLFRYKAMGAVADLCLVLNVLCGLALLSSLGATLTLPGIAGIALTIGFAVDANVLIIERVREELRKGSSFVMALKEGYNRAMSAILDANITTAATACVLLYFGTGPVRGFAVTLLIGIATTLFANVFLSKVFLDFLVSRGVKKLSV